jgi:sugar phosphate isomerase/epimerase
MALDSFSRRSFLTTSLAVSGAAPLLAAKARKIPIGLELYSVRDVLSQDLMGTVRTVAQQGYEVVEFYSPYFAWTPDYARQVRALMDELKIRCLSTHNGLEAFTTGTDHAIEINKILGSNYIVLAHPGRIDDTVEFWSRLADTLNAANTKFAAQGMHVGYHNHQAEWKPVEGQKPLEILARKTSKDIMLQLDIGTCLETGNDPVAWIKANPGRIRCLHLKEWGPDTGYKVLFGEGKADWKAIFAAAEKIGGVEYYLIEQEGYNMPSIETAAKCLANYKKIHG